jgi:hypothetical protein
LTRCGAPHDDTDGLPLAHNTGHVAAAHTFRKIRLRYIIHTGTKQTVAKLTE